MSERVRVGTRAEVERGGSVTVSIPGGRVAVFADGGELFAVDNRCPHMGFPLDRGSVRDGILTCHWHQARFDLRSGCTFDLFADDVARFRVEVEGDEVFVDPRPLRRRDSAYHLRRLRRGMEQSVPLVQAKSLLALLELDTPLPEIGRAVGAYAGECLGSFSEGMVRLTCVANLFPYLSRETAYQALFYAVRQIASEAASSIPRRGAAPLESTDHDAATIDRWLRQWVQTRHRDAAERTVLTALEGGLPQAELAGAVFGASADRLYASGGHVVDFANKTFELVELLGSEAAASTFRLLVPLMTSSRGAEESTDWHHPIEIAEPLRETERALPELLARGAGETWKHDTDLVETLLGDDPLTIIEALRAALAGGAPPAELSKRVAYAAALRLARFATSNEVTDWLNPQHAFNHANAVHQAVLRSPTPDVVRLIFQAAIAVYHDRYLNVPAARLPQERGGLDKLPSDMGELRRALLAAFDRRAAVEPAARLVSRYLSLGYPVDRLVDTLVFAAVREDLDFHTLQGLDAAAAQVREWDPDGEGRPEAEHILVGATRSLAAQCPTRRAGQQTANIALRLHRGEEVFREED